MLSNKDRMAAHRRLFAVIFWFGRCQAEGDKLFCMAGDGFRAFIDAVLAFFWAELETLAKRGACKALKNAIGIVHCGTSFPTLKTVWYAAGIK